MFVTHRAYLITLEHLLLSINLLMNVHKISLPLENTPCHIVKRQSNIKLEGGGQIIPNGTQYMSVSKQRILI
jgi:hypothetical protein